jgi:hypothetical protein
MATTPPGWYDDGHGALRWWDGAQWTEHVVAPDPETDADAPTEAEIVAEAEAETEYDAVPLPAGAAAAPGVGVPPAVGAPGAPADHMQPAAAEYPGVAAHPQHPQGTYPGGYPGEAGATGIFTAATAPQKSKLWIVWVVLGVVMLGFVIGAAVLIPVLLGMNAGGGSSGAAPSSADEESAVAAVEQYDSAWQSVDCDAYVASTSEAYREASWPDCDSFTATAAEFAAGAENYTIEVIDIEEQAGSIVLSTVETYDALIDDAGAPLANPERTEVAYEYTLVSIDGDWVIDDIEN